MSSSEDGEVSYDDKMNGSNSEEEEEEEVEDEEEEVEDEEESYSDEDNRKSKRKKLKRGDSKKVSSESEGEIVEKERPSKKKARKEPSAAILRRRAKALFDEEAEVSGTESGSEEEGSEGENEYQKDGFVVDDEEVEDVKLKSARRRKIFNRLKRVKDVQAPDADDLELVREAQIALGIVDERKEREMQEALEARNAKDLALQLFDQPLDEEEGRREPGASLQKPSRSFREDDFDSEDEGDFIVDDIGGMYSQERRSHRRKEGRLSMPDDRMSGMIDEQTEELLELFGEGIAETAQTFSGDLMIPHESKVGKKIQSTAGIEPAILRQNFYTVADRDIQFRDQPERMQHRMPNRGAITDAERMDEAKWIYKQMNLKTLHSERDMLNAIERVVYFIEAEGCEIPFILHHRKDWYHPYLTREDLWRVFDFDERWEKIGRRREGAARAINTLWRKVRGDAESGDELQDEDLSSETEEDRIQRLAEESHAREDGLVRLRRAEKALQSAEKLLSEAEQKMKKGADAINAELLNLPNNDAMNESSGDEEARNQMAKYEQARKAVSDQDLVDEHDRRRRAAETSRSYLEGLKGELAIIDEEIEEAAAARQQRKKQRKQEKRESRYRARQAIRESLQEVASLFPETYREMLTDLNEEQLKDLQEYYALVTMSSSAGGDDEDGMQTSRIESSVQKHKRALRVDRDVYRVCRKNGLRGIADAFSITAPQLGMAFGGVRFGQIEVTPFPPTPDETPERFAREILETTSIFRDEKAVLHGVKHMLAREISMEPRVRTMCRTLYRNSAVICTEPTFRGKQEIDFFHQAHGLQYIHRKPIKSYLEDEDSFEMPKADNKTQFLRIELAQKEGLLTYSIRPPEKVISAQDFDRFGKPIDTYEVDLDLFLNVMAPHYNPPVYDQRPNSQLWSDMRQEVLRIAIVEYLLPSLEAETVQVLRTRAREQVILAAADEFTRRISMGPWVPENTTTYDRLTNDPQERKALDYIIAVGVHVSRDGRQPSFAVALDPFGSVIAHIILPFGKDVLATRMREFLIAHKPGIIAVGTGAEGDSRRMFQALSYKKKNEDDFEMEMGIIPDALEEFQRLREGQNRERRSSSFNDHEDDSDREGNNKLKDNMMEDDFYDEWNHCEAHLIHDDLAVIFANSERGKQEFPEFHENLRSAISIGRFVQEPLAEYAGLWSHMSSSGEFGEEVLSLRLHPMQNEVNKTMLLKALQQRMLDVVNDVGVDLNLAIEKEHMRGLLHFVAGLGPRKVAALRNGISQALGGFVLSRRQLSDNNLLGPTTYLNAIGFLRIRKRGRLENRDDVNPFDDTRIHTECYIKYHWARQICANALDVDPEEYKQIVASIRDDSREALKSMLLNNPDWVPDKKMPELKDKLEELDLVEFANELDRQGFGKRLMQLELVKDEIRFPYFDPRQPLARASESELFEWITGESDATIRPGIQVTCSVTGHTTGGLRVSIEGMSKGIFGFVPRDCMADDDTTNDDLTIRFPRGSIQSAVVYEVKKERFEVLLSLRKSDLTVEPAYLADTWYRPESLPHIDTEFNMEACAKNWQQQLDEVQIALRQARISDDSAAQQAVATAPIISSAKNRMLHRSILHPSFLNVSYLEAEAKLKNEMDVGDAIIRPSSKNADTLTITWMWMPNEFKHIEVREMNKPNNNKVLLGAKLIIREDEFESLDEIMVRYIAVLNDAVQEMIHHPKYRSEGKETVEQELIKLKSRAPSSIPYLFTRHKSPGYFLLMYVPGKSVRGELVEITPRGYRIRTKELSTMLEMINWFKKNFKDLPEMPKPAPRPRTPTPDENQGNGWNVQDSNPVQSSGWGTQTDSNSWENKRGESSAGLNSKQSAWGAAESSTSIWGGELQSKNEPTNDWGVAGDSAPVKTESASAWGGSSTDNASTGAWGGSSTGNTSTGAWGGSSTANASTGAWGGSSTGNASTGAWGESSTGNTSTGAWGSRSGGNSMQANNPSTSTYGQGRGRGRDSYNSSGGGSIYGPSSRGRGSRDGGARGSRDDGAWESSGGGRNARGGRNNFRDNRNAGSNSSSNGGGSYYGPSSRPTTSNGWSNQNKPSTPGDSSNTWGNQPEKGTPWGGVAGASPSGSASAWGSNETILAPKSPWGNAGDASPARSAGAWGSNEISSAPKSPWTNTGGTSSAQSTGAWGSTEVLSAPKSPWGNTDGASPARSTGAWAADEATSAPKSPWGNTGGASPARSTGAWGADESSQPKDAWGQSKLKPEQVTQTSGWGS